MSWNLYHVEHPVGAFIGVARSEAEAREHFGTQAKITLLSDDEAVKRVIELRLRGSERVVEEGGRGGGISSFFFSAY